MLKIRIKVYGDKMKKKILLLTVLLVSFLFNSCINISPFFNSFYMNYDFVNKKNRNVVIDRKGEFGEWASPEIIIKDVKFSFDLSIDGERSYGKNIKSYYPWFEISAPKGKYIDHVLINKISIYAGKIEFRMLKRVSSVGIWLESGAAPNIHDLFSLTKEEIADVRSTGLINRTVYIDDKGTLINAQEVFLRFSSVPIDSKYKEIRMSFDIIVKYTTGEEIIINQEVTGFLKLKKMKTKLSDYIWYP
jgi:hypothetical protein